MERHARHSPPDIPRIDAAPVGAFRRAPLGPGVSVIVVRPYLPLGPLKALCLGGHVREDGVRQPLAPNEPGLQAPIGMGGSHFLQVHELPRPRGGQLPRAQDLRQTTVMASTGRSARTFDHERNAETNGPEQEQDAS